MNSLQLKANAKINIGLVIHGRRPDGFHELESFFQEIDFGDKIDLQKSDTVIFTTDSTTLANEQNNLCIQAARLMQREMGSLGVKIHLKKQTPIGAGLGGGSSDAAAVLKGIDCLYGLNTGSGKLELLAAQLGSDVPFFIKGGTARVGGRGESITAVAGKSDYFIVLVLPEIFISTVWAYKNLKMGLTKNSLNVKFQGFEMQRLALDEYSGFFSNDFEPLVFSRYPGLKSIRNRLYDLKADFVSLSGSGSAIFGLFPDYQMAKQAKEKMQKQFRVVLTKPVVNSEFKIV